MKDSTAQQLEKEEHNFYGETGEDLELENRRAEAEEHLCDLFKDDNISYDNQ